MRQLNIKSCLSPKNYHLWYTYSAKSDMNLTKVVDGMIEKKMTFNEDLNEKLYEKNSFQPKKTPINNINIFFHRLRLTYYLKY